MKQYLSLTLLVGAFAVALMALFGDDTYHRLNSLKQSIKYQQGNNLELEDKVSKLQSEIAALRFDDQELERRARKELGLARPNEIIFRFEHGLEHEEKAAGVSGSKATLAENLNTNSTEAKNKSVLRRDHD